jgi:hypothetical protein
VAVQRTCAPGAARTNVTEVRVEKFLDAAIARAEPVSQLLVFLVVVAQQGSGDFEKVRARGAPADGLAQCREFQIDVAIKFLIPLAERLSGSQCSHVFASIRIVRIKRDANVVRWARASPAEPHGSSILSSLIHGLCLNDD